MRTFYDLGITPENIEKLRDMYITKPTKIQEQVISLILKGRDIIGKAQTGTGKTLAFVLPLIQMIDDNVNTPQVLIITPTRELALQITNVIIELIKDTNINVVSVYGGHDVEKQKNQLKNNAQFVVGTPGRILDHIREGSINFKNLKHIVIDEADQMMAFGFMEDLELLFEKTPEKIQKMIFSATIPDMIKKLARKIMNNAMTIDIDPENVVIENIRQVVIRTTEDRRIESLDMALKEFRPFMAMIFCKSKERANELYDKMIEMKYDVEIIHGDFSQNKRENIMKRFRDLKFPFLVTTDISARGMDIDGITHVFNFDIPKQIEYYIHRVGRTGRAGEKGIAISFVSDREVEHMKKIQKAIGISVPEGYDRSPEERKRINKETLLEGKVKNTEVRYRRAKAPKISLVTARKSGNRRTKPRKGSGK